MLVKVRCQYLHGMDVYLPLNDLAKKLLLFKKTRADRKHQLTYFNYNDLGQMKDMGFIVQLEIPDRDQVKTITL